ncbi:MAG: RagB/SusD family nutrient uptake outer membrane protein, partial [Bacteroidetes bacterium]|nr:RagB/SusD family nutrient uptake outer membrane protein [Bacteroidota bacterium]
MVFLAGALIVVIASCKKTLDKQSFSQVPDVTAYASPTKVLQSLNGVYDAAQSGFYASGAVRGYPFGAATIEQGDMRGEDMMNQATFYQITYEATYANNTANNDYMFQTLYSLINKANLTIVGITGAGASGVITQAKSLQYQAECRLLRAMAHHELVLHFARPYADGAGSKMGIIYRDFAITGTNTDSAAAIKRSSFKVSDDYAKILADLDFAETNLPAVPDVTTYRASKAVAIALKMRVKMHMGDWAGVITEGAKIVSGTYPNFSSPVNNYKLTASADGPFASNTSSESLFSMKNDATDNSGVNGGLAQMYGDPALTGRGLVRVSPIIWSDPDWKCNDLRRTLLFRTAGSPVNAVYTTKYRDYTNLSDGTPLIRYSEVLLMLAEAQARQSVTVSQTAIDLLNAVHVRAFATADQAANTFIVANFATPVDLVKAILKERRIEFLAEGKRWGDISRLALDANYAPVAGGGIPAKVGTGAATAAMFNCAGATVTKSIGSIPYSD